MTSFFSFNLCSNQLLNGSKSLPLLLACHPLVITHMELCQWHKALMELLPQLLQCLLRLPLSINIFYNHFHSHFRAPHRHLRRRFAECEIKTKLSLNRESPKKKKYEKFCEWRYKKTTQVISRVPCLDMSSCFGEKQSTKSHQIHRTSHARFDGQTILYASRNIDPLQVAVIQVRWLNGAKKRLTPSNAQWR